MCPPLDTDFGVIEDVMPGESYCINETEYRQCVDPGNGQCPEWDFYATCAWNDGICIQYGTNHDCGLQ